MLHALIELVRTSLRITKIALVIFGLTPSLLIMICAGGHFLKGR
tara:strand:+ start:372 stop:503 length:132 start_codon:yes stop_codon:yes gene_type:complete